MTRAAEILDVAPARRDVWLAGQIDEVHENLIEALNKNTAEMARSRRVMTGLMIALIGATVIIPLAWIIH